MKKNEFISFGGNKDKTFQEEWTPDRNWLNIPFSFRGCFVSPPSGGKSFCVKQIILRSSPLYDKVIVVHYGADDKGGGTDDYKEFEDEPGFSVVSLDELPDPRKINPKKEKMLLVLEDIPLSHLNKIQKQQLDRLYGYASSHRGVSVITCCQDPFDCPVGARRCSNLFVIWKSPDLLALSNLASRTGYKPDDYRRLFKLCKTKHDSIWIDLTDGSPAPLRLNGYTPIDLDQLPEA